MTATAQTTPSPTRELTLTRVFDAPRSLVFRMWTESKQRQALGYWLEALYQLCTLGPAREYRQYLAEAILIAEDLGLGLPPSLLGANPEVVRPQHRIACPSPTDSRIRVANLSCGDKREFLAVNYSSVACELVWEGDPKHALAWTAPDGKAIRTSGSTYRTTACRDGWGRPRRHRNPTRVSCLAAATHLWLAGHR